MTNKTTDVFFDLDHTLWDFDVNSELAFETILKKDFPTILIADFMEKYAPINQACWKLYQYDKITHEELRYNRLKHTFDALEYSVTDLQINIIADDYLQLLPENNCLFDGAMEVLEYLEKNINCILLPMVLRRYNSRKLKIQKMMVFSKPLPILKWLV